MPSLVQETKKGPGLEPLNTQQDNDNCLIHLIYDRSRRGGPKNNVWEGDFQIKQVQ